MASSMDATQFLSQIAALNKSMADLKEGYDKQLEGMKADYDESLDTIWMLLAGMLVFFMHAGFALLESGSVRFKNAQHVLSKNLLVVTIGFLCWYIVGWSIAYGIIQNPNKFMGSTQFAMDGFWDDKTLFRNWFFQGAFCATGCTIVSGAMAERTQLKGFVPLAVALCSFIYPVVAYWGWSGAGFLNYTDDDGESVSAFGPAYKDFAGSGIVHLVGGMGALVGALCVGARKGRFDDNKTDEEIDAFGAHSIPFCVLGTFCLWFGWYGFNPGSTLSMKSAGDAHIAGLVAVNTTISPCVAGLLVFFLRAHVVEPKFLDVGSFCNGILAGLVSITAGCAFVKPWEAALIGLIGGCVYQAASMTLKKLKIDDVVDAFPVHGACGIWGVLALGFFGNPEDGMGGNGVFYGGDQLWTQVMGLVCIIAWTGSLCATILVPLRQAGMLRWSDAFQELGADAVEHSPRRSKSDSESWGEDSTKQVVPTAEKIKTGSCETTKKVDSIENSQQESSASPKVNNSQQENTDVAMV